MTNYERLILEITNDKKNFAKNLIQYNDSNGMFYVSDGTSFETSEDAIEYELKWLDKEVKTHRSKKMIKTRELIEAIRSVVWYNGLAYDLIILADEIKECSTFSYKKPEWFKNRIIENNQYEFIWIMLVEMYGDCGTSPRSGWIEDKENAYNFIQTIIKWEDGSNMND